jgi:YebC/PmpR family DNA-binding regulatory protein
MAGHSHSANVKYRKDRVNAAKAKVFSKIARMLTVAAKLGGGDPDANPRLRLAVDKARMVSMPKDSIERAINKGTGGGQVGDYEEFLYEGYGPSGVAVLLEIMTDNRNRTAPEIRRIFEKNGGKLGGSGEVAWMFERKALFAVEPSAELGEDQLVEIVLEAGAEDLVEAGEAFEIRCAPGDFVSVREKLEHAGVPLAGAEVGYLPKTTAAIDDVADAQKVVRCIDALEEQDDVQNLYANFDFSDEVIAALSTA